MRKEEVDALIETQTLSRKAILSKLRGNNKAKENKAKPKNKGNNYTDFRSDEYSTVDIKDEDDSI